MLVRFIALSLIGVSLVELVLYWVVSSAHQMPLQIFSCALKSIPAVIGILFLIKAKSLAQWISDKLDE